MTSNDTDYRDAVARQEFLNSQLRGLNDRATQIATRCATDPEKIEVAYRMLDAAEEIDSIDRELELMRAEQ